jgi:hypothetical protein
MASPNASDQRGLVVWDTNLLANLRLMSRRLARNGPFGRVDRRLGV